MGFGTKTDDSPWCVGEGRGDSQRTRVVKDKKEGGTVTDVLCCVGDVRGREGF